MERYYKHGGRGGYNKGYNNNWNNNKYNNTWDPNQKSHFINIPIEDTSFIDAYSDFCKEIKNQTIEEFSPELLQKPGKLHMTVTTLNIGEDPEKIQKVHNILTRLNDDFKTSAEGKITFNFEKYETMGAVQSARVVYAKMIEDENYKRLTNIIHLILKALIDEGIIEKDKINDYFIEYDDIEGKYKIKLHMTLLNILFWNKILKKQGYKPVKTFDATQTLGYMNSKTLPSAEITQINFSRMREDKVTEKYEMLYSYSIL